MDAVFGIVISIAGAVLVVGNVTSARGDDSSSEGRMTSVGTAQQNWGILSRVFSCVAGAIFVLVGLLLTLGLALAL